MRTIESTCCFTGHRPQKLPWGARESDPRRLALQERLEAAVRQAHDRGYRHFICGMALGADLCFARAVLAVKESGCDLALEAAIPCENQAAHWTNPQQEQYRAILARCDQTTLIQREYTPDCLERRNRYMVDRSSLLIAVYNGMPSGTRNTVLYAMKQGLEIVELAPVLE